MNFKQKLQQLASEREKLIISLHQINGAMKLLEQQILETEPESNQPSSTEVITQQSKAKLLKSKA